ncbi:uncharacterized protein [Musca autumnalis]|uniref:uncharacterized protein n=1 Tax=Musca autumnalis TaxID=221902 RepID=UPI003CE8D338
MNFWMIIVWTLLSSLLSYLKVKYNYWDLQSVKQLKPHFLVGHLGKLKSISHREILKEVYDSFKSSAKLAGFYIYTKPVAVILDLDLVKSVLIKDFNFFASRMSYKNEKDIIAQHLFNLEAPLWKPLRSKLTPAFTSGKTQFILPSIKMVAEEFGQTYERSIEESESLNVHDLNARFTVDVISNCLFGFQCHSLKNPEDEFRQISKLILGRTDFGIKSYLFKTTYVEFMKFFGTKRFPQFIEDFFKRVVREGFLEREKSGLVRNDFVDVLIELRKSGELNLDNDQIAAQFFIFFLAGFETSSTAMSHLLFELAKNEEVQEKLRKHIVETLKKHNNELSYEALMDMKYLDQAITETLRMYPAFAYLQRVALEDYKVPGTEITIEKNTDIFIPIKCIHYDPEIYENPHEFKPERFNPSEITKRHPQSFLGFGDGPRNCIGMRFGRIQIKIGLVTLLTKFKFSQSPQTCKEIEFSNHSMVLIPSKPIYLKVEKLCLPVIPSIPGDFLLLIRQILSASSLRSKSGGSPNSHTSGEVLHECNFHWLAITIYTNFKARSWTVNLSTRKNPKEIHNKMNFWMIIVWTLLSSLLSYLKVKYNYWDLQGVKQLKPHFLVGHLGKLKSISHREILKEVYDSFKSSAKLAGFYIYTKPVAVILDLDLVKSVLIKDFNFFASRMLYKNEKDIIAQHLFNLEAPLWKPLRAKLSPAFTSGKLQFIFPSIKQVADEFAETYERSLEESETLNVHDLNGRYTVDVISNCLFGFQCHSLKNPEEEFRQIGKLILGRTDFGIKSYLFKTTYVEFMKFFGTKRFPQVIEDFFRRVVSEGFLEREKSGLMRNDFVDVLVELRKSGELNLDNDQIAAQFFIFFIAGFETSSTAMSHLLFELARNEEVQEKLRKHITETLKQHNNELSYEALMDMKYLDQAITETLRMYPAVAYLQRVALEDYKVPGTEITIEKNTNIFIPIKCIHHDPDIYENPHEFKPERFNTSEVSKRHPQSFLGFGDGPRNCIGLRFGRMQTKIGLVTLLTKFKFLQSTQTCKDIEFSNHSVIMIPNKPIYLKVEKF